MTSGRMCWTLRTQHPNWNPAHRRFSRRLPASPASARTTGRVPRESTTRSPRRLRSRSRPRRRPMSATFVHSSRPAACEVPTCWWARPGARWSASLFARTSPSAVAGLVFSDGASEFLKDELTAEQWNAWMQVIETTTPPGREAPDYESSVTELRAAPSPPCVPTIVLTADTPWNLPLGGSGATWPAWLLAQDRLATLLQARHITDTASGHGIAVENPRVVVNAIRDIVRTVRRRDSTPPTTSTLG